MARAAAIGDNNRKFVSAILVLDPEAAPIWAETNGKSEMSLAELAADPDVIAAVQAGVDLANEKFARVEQIKRFTLFSEEWLPDSEMLTSDVQAKATAV